MSYPPSPKLSVLVVEDDPMIALMISKILDLNGYSAEVVHSGEDALKNLEKGLPDLIMLDLNLPRMDGYDVCRALKKDARFEKIPILMITGNPDKQEQLKGLEVGADDFVLKPFNYEELLTRVLSTIKRAKKDIDAHPLTGLPGTSSLERAVLSAIEQKRPFAALKVDLKNFKAYNDRYGFQRGDEVIRSTARIIHSAMHAERDFLGHLGSDDFFVLTDPAQVEDLCEKIVKHFEQARQGFYELEDSRKGFIETQDRQGQRRRHPLVEIAIGGVSDLGGHFQSLGMIQKVCDEVLASAKSQKNSAYVIDRRQGPQSGRPPKKGKGGPSAKKS